MTFDFTNIWNTYNKNFSDLVLFNLTITNVVIFGFGWDDDAYLSLHIAVLNFGLTINFD